MLLGKLSSRSIGSEGGFNPCQGRRRVGGLLGRNRVTERIASVEAMSAFRPQRVGK